MKKRILSAMFLLLLLQCACTSQQSDPVSSPTSLEELGYTIDLQLLPESMRQDVTLRHEDELYLDWEGSFTSLDLLVYGPLDAEPRTALLLQAVSAGTKSLQFGAEVFPIEDWEEYIVHQNEDIIVFDLYSLAFGTEQTLPEMVQQERQEQQKKLTEQLDALLSETAEDSAEYRELSLALSLPSETRYLAYLWDSCHENIESLIQPVD